MRVTSEADLRPSAPCLDCSWLTCRHDEPGEWYMVTDQVWEQAGMTDTREWISRHPEARTGPTGGPGHYLCIGCLETRLGRRLTPDDFPGLPINLTDWHRKTARLANRLGDAVPVKPPGQSPSGQNQRRSSGPKNHGKQLTRSCQPLGRAGNYRAGASCPVRSAEGRRAASLVSARDCRSPHTRS